MNNIVVQIEGNPRVSVKTFLSLLASWTYITLFTRLHFHCFQMWLQLMYSPNCYPINLMVTFPARVVSSLLWWTNPHWVCMGVFFLPSFLSDRIIITDASLFGWGAHLNSCTEQDTQTSQDSKMHLSVLELQVVQKLCKSLLPFIHTHHVLIMPDKVTTVFYINTQGRVRFISLCAEEVSMWSCCVSS